MKPFIASDKLNFHYENIIYCQIMKYLNHNTLFIKESYHIKNIFIIYVVHFRETLQPQTVSMAKCHTTFDYAKTYSLTQTDLITINKLLFHLINISNNKILEINITITVVMIYNGIFINKPIFPLHITIHISCGFLCRYHATCW
eukprot:297447_1